MMIVNNDSRVINKLEASLIDNARVVIYDHPWTNFSLQDEPWAEFTALEVAACIPCTYCPVLQYNLT